MDCQKPLLNGDNARNLPHFSSNVQTARAYPAGRLVCLYAPQYDADLPAPSEPVETDGTINRRLRDIQVCFQTG